MSYEKQTFEDGQILKAEHLNHIEDGVSDLDQNKLSTEDYLAARTHWVEGGVIEVFPETTMQLTGDIDTAYALQSLMPLVGGTTYKVTWNGVVYECVAFEYEEKGVLVYMLGDYAQLMGKGSTGEPFIIMAYSEAAAELVGTYGLITSIGVAQEVTVSIVYDGEVIHKLDNKFLDLAWIPAITGETQLAAEKTVTNKSGTPTDTTGGFTDLTLDDVWGGMPIIVYFDGTRYEFSITVLEGYAVTDNYAEFLQGTSSIPFYLSIYDKKTTLGITGGGSHTASVYTYAYRKLPWQYIPEISEISAINDTNVLAIMNAMKRGQEARYNGNKVLYAYDTDGTYPRMSWADTKGFNFYDSSFTAKSGNAHMVAAMVPVEGLTEGQFLKYVGSVNGCPIFVTADPMVLTSPSGTTYQITVDDTGTLSATAATE